ncbi:MAG: C40 family peptidase [Saccharospirillum sp.]|uniref:C40 family peptidase n=1 Tax=Saccharospirillum sp. TaxID=2033801 RepID=UPI00329A3A35
MPTKSMFPADGLTPTCHLRNLMLITTASLLLAGCAGYQSYEAGTVSQQPAATGTHASRPGNTTDPTGQSAVTSQLQRVYQRYQGTPYRYGGTTPAGFDCSGFIVTAYREGLNRTVPRTTDMMLSEGQFVRRDQLREGDIVFFRIGGKEQHAGIYLGDNRFIHSATSVGVTESSLGNAYWQQRYSQARRFL